MESERLSIGTGSQDLLYKVSWQLKHLITLSMMYISLQAIASIFNPGDPILVETPAYS